MAKTYSIKTAFEVLDRAVRPLGKIGAAFAKLSKKIAKLGENIVINRYARFQLGEKTE